MDENRYRDPQARKRRDRILTLLLLGSAILCLPTTLLIAPIVGRMWNDPLLLEYGVTGTIAFLILWRVILRSVRSYDPRE